MKKLTLLLLLANLQLFAGGELKIKDHVFPTSPEAAALTKYVNIPIGNFTGTADISIPIYEVQGRNLNLPIDLSYHPSGVKVAEESSWVGLGWALNAGGLITRTVQGSPDDLENGFLHNDFTLPSDINESTEDWFDEQEVALDIESLTAIGLDDCSMIPNEIDRLPDVFQFNFNGYLGSFTIDKSTHKALITPHQNIDIDIVLKDTDGDGIGDGEIDRFIITVEDGTKYVFIDKETSYGQYAQKGKWSIGQDIELSDFGIPDIPLLLDIFKNILEELFPQPQIEGQDNSLEIPLYCSKRIEEHTISWYLSEMIAPNNDYKYEEGCNVAQGDEKYFNDRIIFDYEKVRAPIGQIIPMLEYFTAGGDDCPQVLFPKTHVYSFYSRGIHSRYLSSIKCPSSKTEVTFIHGEEDREDLLNGKVLKGIKVTVNGKDVKDYSLTHNYITADLMPADLTPEEEQVYKRLYFVGLQDNTLLDSCEGIAPEPPKTDPSYTQGIMHPFEFTYDSPEELPKKNSYQFDHWGFYNAKSNNDALFEGKGSSIPATIDAQADQWADRSVNISSKGVIPGVLSSITYPTNSKTNYSYNSHVYVKGGSIVSGGGIRLSKIESKDLYTGQT